MNNKAIPILMTVFLLFSMVTPAFGSIPIEHQNGTTVLNGYAYDEYINSLGSVKLTLTNKTIENGKVIAGTGTLIFDDVEYNINFKDLESRVNPSFVNGWGTAQPSKLPKREDGSELLGISVFSGLSQVAGSFTDIKGNNVAFVTGPRATSLEAIKKRAKFANPYDPSIPEGSGDLWTRGGGYDQSLRVEVVGPNTITSGDAPQWYSTRIWANTSDPSIYAAVDTVYIKTYAPRDSNGYGFSMYNVLPETSSGSTTLSFSVAYKLFSISLSWVDNSVSSSYAPNYSQSTFHPRGLFMKDITYIDRSEQNNSHDGFANQYTMHYISTSPVKKYQGSVYAYIQYVDAIIGTYFTNSISTSSTPYYVSKG